MGLKVTLKHTGQTGQITGTFGKSGKLKVRLDTDIPPEMIEDQTQILNSEVQLIYKKSIW
jgi:ribosomal 30S subunit maturation factor RimM